VPGSAYVNERMTACKWWRKGSVHVNKKKSHRKGRVKEDAEHKIRGEPAKVKTGV